MKPYSAWLAILAAACTTSSPSASAAPGAPPSPPAPSPATPSAPAAHASGGIAEVTPTGEKTSTGNEVLAIGVPRFQLADPDGSEPLVLRARTHTVFTDDVHSIAIWDSTTGVSQRRIAPLMDDLPLIYTSFAVSPDGEWLATGSSSHVRLFKRPFDKSAGEMACSGARAFSHDGKLLACSRAGIEIWDVTQRKRLVPSPKGLPRDTLRDISFAPDDRSLIWRTQAAVQRWEFAGSGAVTTIFQAPARIEHASIAAGGSAAYVGMAGKKNVIVDLANGNATNAPPGFGAVLSPSGRLLAVSVGGAIQVVEVASGKVTWSAKVAAPATRTSFGETDDSLAWTEGDRVRVAMLPAGPITPPPTARFAGWLGAGVAAIASGDDLRALTLSARTWAPADRAALAPKQLPGAPSWARWVADAAGDRLVAAEPSKRHELAPGQRGGEPCNPKQRVWTKAGGAKTLSMACTKQEIDGHEDPGWELGGGWAIGLSATAGAIYDVRTGRRVATVEVPPRRNKHPETAPAYWQAALAPSGDWLALIWHRAILIGSEVPHAPDPREDAMHIDEAATTADCRSAERGCLREYFLELWTMKGVPKRVWQTRLERSIPGRDLTDPATPSGALTFDHDGSRLLLGLDDGEIRVFTMGKSDTPQTEHLLRSAIRTLSIEPSGHWVLSEDATAEQRVWKF